MVSAQWAIQVALVVIVGLGAPIVLGSPEEVGTASRLFMAVFLVVSLADLALGWWFKERAFRMVLRTARSRAHAAGGLVGPSIIAVSLAITPAVFALLLYVGFRNLPGLAGLCILSLIGHALLRPRDDQWRATVKEIGPGANRSA